MPDIHEAGHDLTITEWAKQYGVDGVHPRTVKTWLANGEIPDAYKDPFSQEWRIPRHATRVQRPKTPPAPTGNGVAVPGMPVSMTELIPQWALAQNQALEDKEPTRRESLDEEPAFLRIDEAAYYLGIPQAQILANPEVFEVMQVGVSGSPRVPKRVIKAFEG